MTWYYSRAHEFQEMIEKNLERQGVKDPGLREEMARQYIYTLSASGRLHEVGEYLGCYGRGATEILITSTSLQTSNLPRLDQETYLISRRMADRSLIPLPEEGYSDGKRK
jgi:hypothetical protein